MRSIFIILILAFNIVCANEQIVQENFSNMLKASNEKRWKDVVNYSDFLLKKYPKSSFSKDAYYYLALGYFNLKRYEEANKFFSRYLNKKKIPKYYEESIRYKFQIAKKYFFGRKKPILGIKKLPKWVDGKQDALNLFKEVAQALANDEIAIESQFYIGKILALQEDYQESLESFFEFIKKYPKHPLAIESFIAIGEVYLKKIDPNDFDLDNLELAEINLKNFKEAFPKEKRIKEVEKNICEIKEIYAKRLFTIGAFYERTKKMDAAILYYKKIISLFPDTKTAKLSQKRLIKIR